MATLLPNGIQKKQITLSIKLAMTLGIFTASVFTYSAQAINQHTKASSESTDKSVLIVNKSTLTSRSLSVQVQQFLGANSALEFRETTPDHVLPMFTHLQQVHEGIDIDGAHIVVQRSPKGEIENIFGTVFDSLEDDLPSRSTQQKQASASASSNDFHHVTESYLAAIANGPWRISNWSSTPIIRIIDNQAQRSTRLSFYAENHTAKQFIKPVLYVDDVGAVLETEDHMNHAVQAGSGTGGNEMTGETTYQWVDGASDALADMTFLVNRTGDTCTMEITPDSSWKNNVAVFNGINTAEPYDYRCNNDGSMKPGENTYTNGAFAPLNDAAFHSQVAFNLYENFTITQWNGPLNSRDPLIVRANYGDSDNASWNGNYIALGKGYIEFYPKVSADTIGHELAHAVLENYSAINQSAGISMGIAESFADIAGEVTEYAIREKQGKTNDWKYGAEIFKPTLEDAARYFETPALDGKSINSAKDWNVEVQGHHLAGPMNKAFFHLVNDNEDWDPLIAYDLWLTAAANCWSYSMLYQDAAQCMLSVANSFRSNSELPASVSVADVKQAIILAFAKSDIYLTVSDNLVALYDYERVFSDVMLINRTSSKSGKSPTYDWDISNNGTTDVETDSLNEAVLISPDSQATELTVKLTADDNSNTSNYVRTLDLAAEYCVPSGFGGNTDYIKQVAINNEAFPATTTQPSGYADYANLQPIALKLSDENVFTLTPNDNDYRRRWNLYVDLNGDHDFDDDGEQLYNARSKGVVTARVNLPSIDPAARNKVTRLRVVMDWSNMERPCAHATSGEYEDYAVVLSDEGEPTPDPVADFSFTLPSTGFNVAFTNLSTDEPANVAWSWGYRLTTDATFTEFSTVRSPNFDFSAAGNYVVELKMFEGSTQVSRDEKSFSLTDDEPGGEGYCEAGSGTNGIAIKKVAVHNKGLDNVLVSQTDSVLSNGYTLFDNTLIKQSITQPANFYVSVELSQALHGFNRHVGVWLDKNKDEVFSDDERVFLGSIAQKERQYINVVLSRGEIPTGETRMRIIAKARANPTSPCEVIDNNQNNGEVEDYILSFE